MEHSNKAKSIEGKKPPKKEASLGCSLYLIVPGGPVDPLGGVILSFACCPRVDLPLGKVDRSPSMQGLAGKGVLGEFTVVASPGEEVGPPSPAGCSLSGQPGHPWVNWIQSKGR